MAFTNPSRSTSPRILASYSLRTPATHLQFGWCRAIVSSTAQSMFPDSMEVPLMAASAVLEDIAVETVVEHQIHPQMVRDPEEAEAPRQSLMEAMPPSASWGASIMKPIRNQPDRFTETLFFFR